MTEEYIRFGNKKLRKGFTTGTSAAGAAKAAAAMALTGKLIDSVEIALPDGRMISRPLSQRELTAKGAKAAITKDGGDDPDITTGLDIFAEVTVDDTGEIKLLGGEGVGRVTLKGLKIPVGEAAINPVPRSMIRQNVRAVLPEGYGASVTISVPGGEEIAKRTFNPRLGIVGGISILGSTGIVNPMSEDALKESLSLELKILTSKGYDEIIFAFGNYGLQYLKDAGIPNDRVIKTSNYIGFMLEEAMDQGVKRILLSGHIGKMVKVAGGIFNTHSRKADCRMEILTAYAALEGASQETIMEIYEGKTTTAAVEVIEREHLTGIYQRIVNNAVRRCQNYTYQEIEFGAVLFGDESRLLYMDEKAKEFIKEFQKK